MAVGRISGPLLRANLERNGIDLAVETDLLYIDVTNNRIGVNTNSPNFDLQVVGAIDSTSLQAGLVTIDDVVVDNNQITTSTGDLLLTGATASDNVIINDLSYNQNEISSTANGQDLLINTLDGGTVVINGKLAITDPSVNNPTLVYGSITLLGEPALAEISSNETNLNLNLRANGDGIIILDSITRVLGNLEVTGNIEVNGNITVGDATTDTITIAAEFTSNLIPAMSNSYDIGSASQRWNNLYVSDLLLTSNSVSTTSVNGNVKISPTGTGQVIMDTTKSFRVPLGTTAQRPTVTDPGHLRWNTDDNRHEGWDGSEWRPLSFGQLIKRHYFTATAGQTIFSGNDDTATEYRIVAGTEIVTKNGLILEKNEEYTTSNTVLTLTSPASVGDDINIVSFGTYDVGDFVPQSTGGTFNGGVSITGNLSALNNATVTNNLTVNGSTTLAETTAGNITTTGYLRGPSSFTIDPSPYGDIGGTVVIQGNLQVEGTTTTINSTTLTINDKNLELATGSANAIASDGAGITLDLGTDGTTSLTYVNSTDRWTFDKNVEATAFIGELTGNASTATTAGFADNADTLDGLDSTYFAAQTSVDNLTTDDVAEGTNLYYTQGRFDTAFGNKSTTDLTEGTNLYYTQGRFDTAFGNKSTTDLTEGTNLYYTQTRFDTAFGNKSTTNLSEGTNLYFTAPRAVTAIGGSVNDAGSATDDIWSADKITSYVDGEVGGGAGAVQATTGISDADKLIRTDAAGYLDASFLIGNDTDDLSEGTNLYYTQTRFDTAFGLKDTGDLSEGTNLYYTQGRFDTAFGNKSTTDLSEGTNLYYTQGRFDTAFGLKDTDDLSEGTNLYYTSARANSAIDTRVDKTFVDALSVDADTLDGLNSTAFDLLEPDWVEVSTNQTLAVNTRYEIDFTSGPLTLTLPAAPTDNQYVHFYKAAGDTTSSTIARNGNTIMGLAEDLTIDSDILSLKLIYTGTTWRIF